MVAAHVAAGCQEISPPARLEGLRNVGRSQVAGWLRVENQGAREVGSCDFKFRISDFKQPTVKLDAIGFHRFLDSNRRIREPRGTKMNRNRLVKSGHLFLLSRIWLVSRFQAFFSFFG